MKLDTHAYSPAILHQILAVTGEVKSHAVASKVLQIMGGVRISGRHINRLSDEIGTEMAQARDRYTEDYVHHRRPAPTASAPAVVAIGLDGGRVQTRAPDCGVGVHEAGWKEDKVACLLALEDHTFTEDPHPEPPRCFLDAPYVDEMVREIQAHHGPRQENELPQLAELSLGRPTPADAAATAVPETTATPATPAAVAPPRLWPPERAENGRTCVATMQDCAAFGKLVAAEAYRQHFRAAARGALLGDGSAWIWNVQKKWLDWLTPIADFVHPLTYLYVTATVLAASVTERWRLYVGWMTRCWQGQVNAVLEELAERHRQCGEPPAGHKPSPTEPREVLARTLTYLRNNASRMNYPTYRLQGLPITSSLVESLIKEVNYRVKGTEKFWNRPAGAEAILQIRAAVLSDDERLAGHIHNRPGSAFRRHTKSEKEHAA